MLVTCAAFDVMYAQVAIVLAYLVLRHRERLRLVDCGSK